jgi:hypothetical protein
MAPVSNWAAADAENPKNMNSNASHTPKGAVPNPCALQYVVIPCFGVELDFICLPPKQTLFRNLLRFPFPFSLALLAFSCTLFEWFRPGAGAYSTRSMLVLSRCPAGIPAFSASSCSFAGTAGTDATQDNSSNMVIVYPNEHGHHFFLKSVPIRTPASTSCNAINGLPGRLLS